MALSSTVVWLVVAGVSLGTYALRASFLLGADYVGGIPESFERVLPFVPTAILAALVAPDVVYAGGALALTPDNPRLLAALLAAVVAWRTENMLATVGVGMGALWALQWL